jgi:hypothetical protein
VTWVVLDECVGDAEGEFTVGAAALIAAVVGPIEALISEQAARGIELEDPVPDLNGSSYLRYLRAPRVVLIWAQDHEQEC